MNNNESLLSSQFQLIAVQDLIEGDEIQIDEETLATVVFTGMAGGGEMAIHLTDGTRYYMLPTDLMFCR